MGTTKRLHPAAFIFAAAFIFLATAAVILGKGVDDDWEILLGITLIAILGDYLVAKRPEYRLGWVLAWTSIVAGLTAIPNNLLPEPQPALTLAEGFVAVVMGNVSWGFMFWMGIGLFLLLFPTGRAPSPRWRWVAWLGFGSAALAIPLELLNSQWCYSWGEEPNALQACVENPMGVAGLPGSELALAGIVAAIVASAVAAVVRFARSEGLERRQMKVFVFGVVLLVAVIGLTWVLDLMFDVVPAVAELLWTLLMWVTLPTVTAVAILRHGLYEIDRVISRSVSYLLILLLLGSLFAVVVVAIPETLGLDSNLAVAAGTLAAFFTFRPLLRRVQRQVDKVFNRQRYDAERVLDAFAVTIRDEVDSTRIAEAWTEIIGDTFQPTSVSVWLRKA